MADISANPKLAPDYALHRSAVTSADSLPETERGHGINMASHTTAHIQVVPSGGADPSVEVLWWSEVAQEFVQEHISIERVGVGVDRPYEFDVDSRGRIMFVAITTIAAGAVDVHVSGYNVERV